ncbi:MAG: aspartate kinase [Tannerella sp.]|jgi:aspartate kinase|nr:aspartate kinase [Tannerella sp.]
MKVLKFGGTSVGSAQRMKDVAGLICDGEQKIVVLSAMSGTTNSLVEISDYLYKNNHDGANEIINRLAGKYAGVIDELYGTQEYKDKAGDVVMSYLNYIRSLVKDLFTLFEERAILAQGELMSTAMMNLYLNETGVKSVIIPALDYMRTDKNSEPDPVYIKEKFNDLLAKEPDAEIYITQGFICRNAYGEIDNLQRGGSDYTASLLGAAVRAEEIQIWTDIDGMHNNDPRIVENTSPVRHLHFDEAAELAYFGAKILHPTCILPAKLNNIPVRLLNTMQPDAPGTAISNRMEGKKIKAVAAKDNIISIKIKSGRMLLATGFLRKVFEIFETYRTPIDMVTTSEVGVSVTIDNPKNLEGIVNDLKKYGAVTVDRDMVIVCIVGDLTWENLGFEARVISALKDIPVRMISYGGSNYNISLLIKSSDKKRALQALSEHLFNSQADAALSRNPTTH